MMSGTANVGQYAFAQQSVGAEEMRGMINDAVSAMLPSVQNYLPQQASTNDELVQKLIDQNGHFDLDFLFNNLFYRYLYYLLYYLRLRLRNLIVTYEATEEVL